VKEKKFCFFFVFFSLFRSKEKEQEDEQEVDDDARDGSSLKEMHRASIWFPKKGQEDKVYKLKVLYDLKQASRLGRVRALPTPMRTALRKVLQTLFIHQE